MIRELCQRRDLTQRGAAELLRSDKANVSKAEKSNATVSLDWMIRAAFALGANRRQVGRVICG